MNETNSTATDERTYPDRVYFNTQGQEPFPEDGITVEAAERIASTKPEWAGWQNADIAASTPQNGTVDATWSNDYGSSDTSVTQTALYDEKTGEKVSEEPMEISIWFERTTDPERARKLAHDLLDAADILELATTPGARIINNGFVREVTEVVVYHRVCDGVEVGEIVIPLNGTVNDFARKLAAMQPGDVHEHDLTIGKGFPKEHMIDTFVGVFKVKDHLSDHRTIIVPLTDIDALDVVG